MAKAPGASAFHVYGNAETGYYWQLKQGDVTLAYSAAEVALKSPQEAKDAIERARKALSLKTIRTIVHPS